MIEATGNQLSLKEYLDYTRNNLNQKVLAQDDLRKIWVDSEPP